MFTLPVGEQLVEQADKPMHINEEGVHIAKVLDMLDMRKIPISNMVYDSSDFATILSLAAVNSIARLFGFDDIHRVVEPRLTEEVMHDPLKEFQVASDRQDLDMARLALRNCDFKTLFTEDFSKSFWNATADVRPEWRPALARQLMAELLWIPRGDEVEPRRGLILSRGLVGDMHEIAAAFNP
jgi:inactivated superfamily I helicase